jgi:hypothetical protein
MLAGLIPTLPKQYPSSPIVYDSKQYSSLGLG